MTTPTQVRIDSKVKQKATDLFASLGLDMSTAINIFLHQCVLRGGLPFNVEMPNYNKETLDAINEAKRITNDDSVEGYETVEDLIESLNKD